MTIPTMTRVTRMRTTSPRTTPLMWSLGSQGRTSNRLSHSALHNFVPNCLLLKFWIRLLSQFLDYTSQIRNFLACYSVCHTKVDPTLIAGACVPLRALVPSFACARLTRYLYHAAPGAFQPMVAGLSRDPHKPCFNCQSERKFSFIHQ